ncbi:MAG TPA: hypothetical protein VML75_14420 [Kofleriaceae bacterium]|nr:hypothetical protein [Kofleriaceae bacterium]
MKAHAAALALAAVLGAAGPVHAETSDARSLFAGGQYAAAAAAFEAGWRSDRSSADGINAVVSWRVAGRYAHARVLLEEVAAAPSIDAEHAARIPAIRATLDELTARLVLAGQRHGDTIAVDRAPAEALGDELVVDVGRRELVIERPGCEPFTWNGSLAPTERRSIQVEVVCKHAPGSLHVTLSGAAGGEVVVDGEVHRMTGFDLDLPLAPGSHDVEVKRRGVVVLARRVEIASNATVRLERKIPLAAKAAGYVVGLGGSTSLDSGGGVAGAGLTLGYIVPLGIGTASRGARGLMWLHLGIGAGNRGVLDGRVQWTGMTGGFEDFLRPLWQRQWGRNFATLELEPGLLHFGVARRDAGLFAFDEAFGQVTYFHFVPLILTVDVGGVHGQIALWPLGFSTYSESRFGDHLKDTGYSAGLSTMWGFAFLGN